MEEKTKQRLIGLLVLIGALFIILPFLFHNSRPSLNTQNAPTTTTNSTVSLPLTPANTNAATTATPVNTATPVATTTPANTTTPATTTTPANTTDTNAITGVNTTTQDTSATTSVNPSTTQTPVNQTVPVTTAPTENQNPVNTTAESPTATPAAPSTTPTITPAAPSTTPTVTPSATPAPTSTTPGSTTPSTPASPSTQPTSAAVSPTLLASVPAVTTGKNNPEFQMQAASNDTQQNVQPPHAKPVSVPHHAAAKKALHAGNSNTWEVQLAVFSNQKNAHELMTKLRQHHFEAYTRTIKHNERTLTAVFVGPEMNIQKAHNIRETLRRDFRLNGVVKRYQV